MSSIRVEAFLNNLFSAAAAEREAQQQGKTYRYELCRNYAGKPEMAGECVVLSRSYNASLDCDVLSCKDVATGKTFSCNQFQIILQECF